MEIKEDYKGFQITCRHRDSSGWTMNVSPTEEKLWGKLRYRDKVFNEHRGCADGIAEAKRRIDAA